MKIRVLSTAASLFVLLLAITLCISIPSSKAATEEQIETAITDGLAWLAGEQDPVDGSWDSGMSYGDDSADVAATGLAVLKFVDRAKELGLDPFDTDTGSETYYEYATNVINGLDYIFKYAKSDANGVHFTPGLWLDVYVTGISMMAVAATNDPTRTVSVTGSGVDGWTYQAVLQGMMDWMVFAQNDSACGIGGWSYGANAQTDADQSNAGYATLGIGFAAASPPDGFGLTIPGSVIIGLNTFINNVQVTSGTNQGGSIYNPCGGYPGWVNILKAGNLLYELALVGDIITDTRVQDAISFIETYWNNTAGQCDGCGWKGDYQAMFTLMKGLEAFEIETLTVGASDIDWFDDMSEDIVADQEPNGSWTHDVGDARGGPAIATAWALLTLERVVPRVEFGIPGQCVPYGQAFASFDADDYVIIGTPPFIWTWSGNVNLIVVKGGDNVFTITYPDGWTGSETITFTATDANGKTSNDTATFTVDPVPAVGDIPDQTAPFSTFDLDDFLSGIDPSQVTWSYSGNVCLNVSIDANNVVTVTNPGNACTDPETVTFTATATACDEEVSDSDEATFAPNQPPDCSEGVAGETCLWPPNHKFVDITVVGVTDPDGDPVTITITGITSDEATATDKGSGGAKHAPDASGVGTDTASVRAERSGRADGRVYMIHFTASDGRGGECEGSVMVKVPHDQSSEDCPAIDSGQIYDATQTN